MRIGENKNITPATTGYLYVTRSHPKFTELGKKWYTISDDDRLIKVIPKDLTLDPLSLCIWYMDDGTKEKGKNRCRIATNGFKDEEVLFLRDRLMFDLGLESKVIHNVKCEPMLEIGGYTAYKKLYDLTSSCTQWNCFSHKLEAPKLSIPLSGENHPRSKLTSKQLDLIAELYASGVRQKELAKQFGVKRNTLSAALNGVSWKSKSFPKIGGTKGERNPRAKVNLEQVNVIRSLKGEYSYSQIASQYGISKGAVSSIMNFRSWK